jgi:hypothetical protein
VRELAVHVIPRELPLAAVLENVQDRVGWAPLASLDVLSMRHLLPCAGGLFASAVPVWTACPSADSSGSSVTRGLAPRRPSRASLPADASLGEVAFAFREQGSFPPVLPSKGRVAMGEGSATAPRSLAREASSSGALPTGRDETNWALGVSQSRLHQTRRGLRDGDFCAFSAPAALPPCYGPRGLSTAGKAADLWNMPSISRPLVWR